MLTFFPLAILVVAVLSYMIVSVTREALAPNSSNMADGIGDVLEGLCSLSITGLAVGLATHFFADPLLTGPLLILLLRA